MPEIKKRTTGRPPNAVLDPSGRRAAGGWAMDLQKYLGGMRSVNGDGDRWCWSCCEWSSFRHRTAPCCPRCEEYEESYILPAKSRVKLDGAKLALFRRQNGWSQDQLGKAWDRSRGSICNFERGVHLPKAWHIRALCRLTEKSLEAVLWDLGATHYMPGHHYIEDLVPIWES
jgi:DNA-binding XRE family transcriptional regulator